MRRCWWIQGARANCGRHWCDCWGRPICGRRWAWRGGIVRRGSAGRCAPRSRWSSSGKWWGSKQRPGSVIMSVDSMLRNDKMTLAQRLSEGRLPVTAALGYAVQLAEELRKPHDAGRVHGAVTPSNLEVVATGLGLLPAPEGSARAITPYTAPEVVQGRPADARSDIFGFGAILFEMFTGRQAFDGETRAALSANLTKAPTPGTGSAGVDRLLRKCLSKNPEMRSSGMQKIILELKLLSVAVRRVELVSGAALPRDTAEDSAAARPDMQQLEARLAARLQVHERTIAEMHRSANEAVSSLRLKVAAMNSELATAHQRGANRAGGGLDDAAAETIQARVDRGFEALDARMAQIEQTVEEMRRHTSQFEHNIAADLVDIEQNLKGQIASIESARTAMSQTEDLVEFVVEALESLQTAMADPDEISRRSNLAVN